MLPNSKVPASAEIEMKTVLGLFTGAPNTTERAFETFCAPKLSGIMILPFNVQYYYLYN